MIFSVITVIIGKFKFKFSLLRLGIFFAHLLKYSPGAGDWALNPFIITMKNNIFIAREIKRLLLHAMDKSLTSLPRRNQWSHNNAGHSFEGLEYLRLLITDLNSFEFPSLIWPNLKAYALARYFQEVRRGKELSDFMRLSIVLDPAIIACPLKRKSRSSLLIMISCSTLASYSSIYWKQ